MLTRISCYGQRLAAELDCLLGFAVASLDRGFTEPSIVKESVLYIEEGRHPLCELCAQTFVPNNTSLDVGGVDSAGLIIITGGNFSGKSVYMKQTALIAFMAHIGSFVPAISCQVRDHRLVWLIDDCTLASGVIELILFATSAGGSHR